MLGYIVIRDSWIVIPKSKFQIPNSKFQIPNSKFVNALSQALKLLAVRPYFSLELREKLLAAGFSDGDVEEVVNFLRGRKLLNDDNTTQSLIDRRSGKRAVGTEKLRAELEKRGASEDIAEQLLAVASESERALDALRGKFKLGADRAKAGRFLVGRGFAEEAIETALGEFCGDETFPE